jgi:hypothetical protein
MFMNTQQRRVVLFDGDPMVLEGLKLLLQDMQCMVTIMRYPRVSQLLLDTSDPDCPQLIIAPRLYGNEESGEKLVDEIRIKFGKNIPAILLAYDHSFDSKPVRHDNTVFMDGTINPKQLRTIIAELLDKQ